MVASSQFTIRPSRQIFVVGPLLRSAMAVLVGERMHGCPAGSLNLSPRVPGRNARSAQRLAGRAYTSDDAVVRVEQSPVQNPQLPGDGNRARARAAQREHRGGNGIDVRPRGQLIERERGEVRRLSNLDRSDFVGGAEALRS